MHTACEQLPSLYLLWAMCVCEKESLCGWCVMLLPCSIAVSACVQVCTYVM